MLTQNKFDELVIKMISLIRKETNNPEEFINVILVIVINFLFDISENNEIFKENLETLIERMKNFPIDKVIR
jgi:hypothetical protein